MVVTEEQALQDLQDPVSFSCQLRQRDAGALTFCSSDQHLLPYKGTHELLMQGSISLSATKLQALHLGPHAPFRDAQLVVLLAAEGKLALCFGQSCVE